jgi:hypothetical protein
MEDFTPSGCTRASPSMQQYHLGTSIIDFVFTTTGHKTSRSDSFFNDETCATVKRCHDESLALWLVLEYYLFWHELLVFCFCLAQDAICFCLVLSAL